MSTPSTAPALTLDIANPYSYTNYNPLNQHENHRLVLHPPNTRSRLPAQHPYSLAPLTQSPAHDSGSVSSASSPHTSVMARTQQATSAGSSTSARREGRRAADWGEFYKNGVPKEVIVIDDTPPPPTTTSTRRRANGNAQPVAPIIQSRHTEKKRKTQTNHYEPVFSHDQSYSATNTPHLNGNYASPTTVSAPSSSGSVVGTTAGTSLNSNGGINDYAATAAEIAAINSQKRRRVTRAAAAAANALDAFASYHPPPKPPIKAKEVYVKVIPDPERISQHKVDDQDGHYIVLPDTDLTPRYKIIKLLGQGTFGKVVEAYDRDNDTKCAIKVIRSVQKYRDASKIELRVLSTLSSNDRDNRNKCIHLRDCFDFRHHICIVTDLLGMSVFDFLKGNAFAPFPSSHIQSFARQLITSVAFLHDLNLIHTDLKPENILLVNNDFRVYNYQRAIPSSSTQISRQGRTRRVLVDTDIRLIDFGSATFNDEYHSSVVSTRHYRAPEIILGLGWSFPCDIWSIGCILVEFFTGDALFQTHDNLEHLAMMQSVCGSRIDAKLVRSIAGKNGSSNNTNNAFKYFRNSKLDYPNAETTRASRKYVQAMKHLTEIIPANSTFNKQFLDLLKKIFVYDPSKRITAKDALKHPWFRDGIQDEGTDVLKILERERASGAYRETKSSY